MSFQLARVLALVSVLCFSGCPGEKGADGADGADGEDANTALMTVTAAVSGGMCEFGGQQFDVGVDDDGDDILDSDEIDTTTYVCDGAAGPTGSPGDAGPAGPSGAATLIRLTDEAAGENCAAGGQMIEAGTDANADGTLNDNEVDSTSFVCDGCDEGECEEPVAVPQSARTNVCLGCHSSQSPGIVDRWLQSAHYRSGIGCNECHKAEDGDVDAIVNHMASGLTIAILVTPTDCATCHAQAVKEFTNSYHARAGEILNSLDNRLAEVIEGDDSFDGASPVAVTGCNSCHGSVIEVEAGGGLSATTYPNSGIGRVNPDGSKGACSACHMRHDFSAAQARRPENCGRCHMGPDHPHIEIYNESQHGVLFYANVDEMNLGSRRWVAGVDYSAAPTCATCHMGATQGQPSTHDVGERLYWNLRVPVSGPSKRAIALAADNGSDEWTEANALRSNMKDVCLSCHASTHTNNFFEQVDAGVALYNNKFAIPATAIYDLVRGDDDTFAVSLITSDTFDDELEWAYFFLWHHEGRRARAGMAMAGADYAQWHGFYEVAERFYFEFIPQAREIADHHLDAAAPDYDAGTDAQALEVLDRIHTVLCAPEHLWFGEEDCL